MPAFAELRDRIANKKRIDALWTPAWYAGDQPLHSGIWENYQMVRYESEETTKAFSAQNGDAIFYNERFPSHVRYRERALENTFRLCGRISRIHSEALGDLLGLTYHYFDYYITLADGTLLRMNCEEEIGRIYERDITLGQFDLLVTIDVRDFDNNRINWETLNAV